MKIDRRKKIKLNKRPEVILPEAVQPEVVQPEVVEKTEKIKNMNINVIVFSKDRACQLDCFLKSLKKFWPSCKLENITILYTYSTDAYKLGYELVQEYHPEVNFHFETGFKDDLMNLINKENSFTVFFVDDNIFIDYFEPGSKEFQRFIEDPCILCFSLRLGNNIIYDYSNNIPVDIPEKEEDGSFIWLDREGVWGYPMSVDGHVFKTGDLLYIIKKHKIDFNNPNTFEGELAAHPLKTKNKMICPERTSILFNSPINRVQNTYENRHANSFPPKTLNHYFLKKIMISPKSFENFLPEAPHAAVDISFTLGVSILMPLYNGIDFIEKSIKSVIYQTHENWELIIGVNGHGENPDFFDEIKEKFKKEKRIKILNFPNTNGKAETLNEMVLHCTKDWVSILDVDDVWKSTKLERQIQYAGEYEVIGTRCKYFGKKDLEHSEPFLYFGKINKTVFDRTNPIINSSSLFRKKYAYWDPEFEGVEDFELWYKLNKKGVKFFNINEYLVYHRLHGKSSFNTHTYFDKIEEIKNKWK